MVTVCAAPVLFVARDYGRFRIFDVLGRPKRYEHQATGTAPALAAFSAPVPSALTLKTPNKYVFAANGEVAEWLKAAVC